VRFMADSVDIGSKSDDSSSDVGGVRANNAAANTLQVFIAAA